MNKKLKAEHNFLIALIAYILLAYEYIYHFEIIDHPYMFFLIMFLFSVGGWNVGVGLAKLIKK